MRRKDLTSDTIRKRISDSPLQLMNEKKYNDITINEIAKKADIDRATYYRHFKKKEEVAQYYYDSIMDEYLKLFNSNGNKKIEVYLETMFEVFFSKRESLLTLHKANLSYLILPVHTPQSQPSLLLCSL